MMVTDFHGADGSIKRKPRRFFAGVAVFLVALALAAGGTAAWACSQPENQETQQTDSDDHSDNTQPHIDVEFSNLKHWLLNEVFPKYIYPPLIHMTYQLAVTASHQMVIVGAFIDAKEQLEVQRLFREMVVRTHKEYKPSVGICSFGTTIRSLASTERRGEANTFIMSQWQQDRETGNVDVGGTEGEKSDRGGRSAQFKGRYCEPTDNGQGLGMLCDGATAPAKTRNRDIDYARTIEQASTLEVDFTDAETTDDEQDIIALSRNLYAHELPVRISETTFHVEDNKPRALDVRTLAAQRSVAEATFDTIVGMKSLGTPEPAAPGGGPVPIVGSGDTSQYLKLLLEALDMPPEAIKQLLWNEDDPRPSYFAQMEIFTKKLFQNPAFYVELYESPANVGRKKVALQTIELMQDFDTLQSYLRTEMMLSLVLELEILRLQDAVQNRVNALRQEGENVPG